MRTAQRPLGAPAKGGGVMGKGWSWRELKNADKTQAARNIQKGFQKTAGFPFLLTKKSPKSLYFCKIV
jgi:hypothetical protein